MGGLGEESELPRDGNVNVIPVIMRRMRMMMRIVLTNWGFGRQAGR
jgi:hypothetical protein